MVVEISACLGEHYEIKCRQFREAVLREKVDSS